MMHNQHHRNSKLTITVVFLSMIFTAFLSAQEIPLTFSWDKTGCQLNNNSKIAFDNNFSNSACLKVCPKSVTTYRISGDNVENIARIEWTVSGGEAAITSEFSTPIKWDESSDGSIEIYIKYRDSTQVTRSICVDKTPSSLILSWDKIGCQVNKDNVSEIKYDHNFSNAACLKVCPESKVIYEISGDGLPNIESINWTIIGGTSDSSNERVTLVTWNNELNGSIQIAIHFTNGTNVQRTICIRKVPSSLLLDWEKLEKSVCEIKYDNSPDNAEVLSVYPESTVLYRITGKGVENIDTINWSINEGGYIYSPDELTTLIMWDNIEKSVLTINIHYRTGEEITRNINVLRAQPPGGGQNVPIALKFLYDDAGNQIQRKICINCNSKQASGPRQVIPKNLTDKDYIQDPVKQISYYPNPVSEKLYLKWENTSLKTLSSIELYSLVGQHVKSYKHLNSLQNTIVSFEEYPSGNYNLIMVYSNGEEKVLKIIKQ